MLSCSILSLLLVGQPGASLGLVLHSCLHLEDLGIGCELGLLTSPLPGLQEAVPRAAGSSGAPEHHCAGGLAPAPETAETTGEAHGWGAAWGRRRGEASQPFRSSWPNPDSDHPPRPATGGARPRPQGPLLAECPGPAAWRGQPAASGSSSPSLMPGPGSLSLLLGCLHPLQGPLGLLPVWPNDSEVRAIKQLEGQCLHAGPSPALPAWTLSPGDHFFPSSCLLPSPGRREATPTALWLVRALEGRGQPPAPLGPHLYSAGAGASWEEEGSAELPSRQGTSRELGATPHGDTISSRISPCSSGIVTAAGPSRRCQEW